MSQETQVVQTLTFTLTGNLGADPEPHSLPAQTILWTDYDPITEETVEKAYDEPGLKFLTFPLATGGSWGPPTGTTASIGKGEPATFARAIASG